ncbi:MAG: PAS domain S-box protein [Acidimicrobiia bacterium]
MATKDTDATTAPVPKPAPGTDGPGIGLLDALPDGVVITDRAGTITATNERAAELFGYPAGELEGRPVEDLLPEALRQVHRAHRLRYTAAPRVRPMGIGLELWGRRADGAEFPLEISLSPWRSDDGPRFVAVVRDVSARYQAEAELRTVYDLLDRVSEAVYMLDGDSLEIVYANEGAGLLSAYDRRDLVGMTPLHLLPELDDAALHAWTAAAVAGGSAEPLVTLLRTRDGIDRTVECRLEAPAPARGRARRFVVMTRDVSVRLAAEEELRAMQRTAALSDDRERIARDLHDTAIQELFATGLGLQGVAMQAPPALQSRLGDAVEHIDAVIRQIRAAIFSMSMTHSGDGVAGTITELVTESQRSLGFRPGLQLNGPVDTVISGEVADDLLATVREALSNVARHAGASRVQVVVEATNTGVELTVTDNGRGLQPRPDQGPGRGLRNLVARAERHGGQCTLVSGDGGTTLNWSVPF